MGNLIPMSDSPFVKTCYGIDLSEDAIIIVRGRRAGRRIEYETVYDGRVDPADDAWNRARDELRRDGGLQVGCLPVRECITRWLATPFASWAKSRKVLPSLLDIQLPFPLETCVYGFPAHRPGADGAIQALAVAARAHSVTARADRYQQAGLEPMLLDHEGLALWSRAPATPGSRAVCYIGHDRASLVWGGGEQIAGAHHIRFGVAAWRQGGDAAIKEFADRVQRVLQSQSESAGPAGLQWTWTGPGAQDPNLLDRLQKQMSFIPADAFRVTERPAAFLAEALCARAMEPAGAAWNFLTGQLAHPRMLEWDRQRDRRAAGIWIAAGLMLCLLNVAWLFALDAREERIQQRITRLASELTGAPQSARGEDLLLIVRRAMDERQGQVTPFIEAFNPPDTAVLADILRLAGEAGLSYESVSIRPDYVLVQGATDDWNRCDALKSFLESRGYNVTLDRQDAREDERVHFRVTAGGVR